jgi:hypothetical protein
MTAAQGVTAIDVAACPAGNVGRTRRPAVTASRGGHSASCTLGSPVIGQRGPALRRPGRSGI